MQISGSQILDCIDYENHSNLRATQLYFRVLTKIIQLLICAELSANPIVRHDNYDMTEVLLTASLCKLVSERAFICLFWEVLY